MKTPHGQLVALTRALKRFARYGDVRGLRNYVLSDAFIEAFAALDPPRRRAAMKVYVAAETACEAATRQPLPKPKSMGVATVNWRDPVMLAKLRNAYARTGNFEGAARICGVTPGSARLAYRRYVDSSATSSCAVAA